MARTTVSEDLCQFLVIQEAHESTWTVVLDQIVRAESNALLGLSIRALRYGCCPGTCQHDAVHHALAIIRLRSYVEVHRKRKEYPIRSAD